MMAHTATEAARQFWREVLGDNPTPEQIEAELHDFYLCIQEVPKVYDELTQGRFTKATTMAQYIIDRVRELEDEALAELEADNAALAARAERAETVMEAARAHMQARERYYHQLARLSGWHEGRPLDDGSAARETWQQLRAALAASPVAAGPGGRGEEGK